MAHYTCTPKVSVLMPTYNRAEYLKEAIESVLTQTLSNIEVIIVDNNSTDNTPQIVASFVDSRVLYIRNSENIGAVNNYNKALRLAKGDYIYLFSDDDVMSDVDNLSEKASVLDNFPNVGVVHSGINTIDELGNVIGGHWAAITSNWTELTANALLTGERAFRELYYSWNFISMPTVLLRRSLIVAFNLEFNNQLKYLIDWNLWMQLAFVSDFFYINKPLINYRVHKTSESNKLSAQIYFNELLVAKLGLLTLSHISTNGNEVRVEDDVQNIVRLTQMQLGLYVFKEDNFTIKFLKNIKYKINRKYC